MSNGVEIVAVSAIGEIERVTTYGLPISSQTTIRRRIAGVAADHSELGKMFQGDANLASMVLSNFLVDLADQLERVMEGEIGAGSKP